MASPAAVDRRAALFSFPTGIMDDSRWMRLTIDDSKVAMLALLVGCAPPPMEVTTGGSTEGGASSGGPPPSTTSGPADTTASGSASGGGSTGPTSAADTSGSGGEHDSSTGEPMDEPLGRFGTPVVATMLNSAGNEDDPSLTGDLLEIYFNSNRGGSDDVWTSSRIAVGADWDVPAPVESLNSPFTETFPEVSADGLFMLLASNRADGGDLDIYYSQRGGRGAAWPAPMLLPGASTAADDYGATPSPDLSRVFLCRDVAGGRGQSDIWEAPADFVAWMVQAPVLVAELSTPQADCSSTLSPSRREIFFETTRSEQGMFDWDLWMATRDDPDGTWDDPVSVVELNSAVDDIDPWLSPDRRTLWFARGTWGTYELYEATRR